MANPVEVEPKQEMPEREAAPAAEPGERITLSDRRRSFFQKHPAMRVVTPLALILVVAGTVLLWRYFASYESTDDAQVDGHLNTISPRVGGYVIKVNVDDNQYVEAGTLLVQIDPRDYQVAVDRARAELADAEAAARAAHVNVPITSVSTSSGLSAAEADVLNAQAGVAWAEGQQQAATATLRQAEANNARAQDDVKRYRALVEKQEISQQQYDQAATTAAATAAAVDAARALAASAQQTVAQARSKTIQAEANLRAAKTAPQQVSATQAKAESAIAAVQRRRAELAQAELNLQYTTVRAPVNGVVGRKNVELGENVQPGQALMDVIPLDDVWVTANFKETQLKNMRSGQRASIKVDANGREYKGHVLSIAGASGARFSLLPPENATGNYVKVVQRIPVKITLDPGENSDHQLRPGMSVIPKVKVQ
ncbi:MAG TPA: HlyD family secretion protein [Terriglobales bacterium]|nr:HlyD family secretion protein [Terriglobales bacterium]